MIDELVKSTNQLNLPNSDYFINKTLEPIYNMYTNISHDLSSVAYFVSDNAPTIGLSVLGAGLAISAFKYLKNTINSVVEFYDIIKIIE